MPSLVTPAIVSSKQLAAGRHVLLSQILPAQSTFEAHRRPAAQPGQAPPQSTSVSLPFFTVSVHVGAMHFDAAHTPDAQSSGTAQARLSPQRVVHELPQSTSVSLPFFTESMHDSAPPSSTIGLKLALGTLHATTNTTATMCVRNGTS
jgi:hypothetical protein